MNRIPLPSRDGSLQITRDILLRCIEKGACWGGLHWAFGSESGPRTVRELALTPYVAWCVGYYVLPRPHREELYMLTGCAKNRRGRACSVDGYYENGIYRSWPAGHVRSIADMYPAEKGGAR